MTIKRQLILFFAPLIAIISIMLTAYTQYQAYNSAIEAAHISAINIASDQSSAVQTNITRSTGFIAVFTAMMAEILTNEDTTRKDIVELLLAAAKSDKSFFGLGVILPDFDSSNNEKYKKTEFGNVDGVCAPYISFPKGIDKKFEQISYEGEDYFSPYKDGKKRITAPYVDSNQVFMITLTEAIRVKGKIVGVVFLDISLANLSNLVKNVKTPYKNAVAFVTDNNGDIVAHPDSSEHMHSIKDLDGVNKTQIVKDLENDEIIHENGMRKDGTEIVTVLYPFNISEDSPPWYFGLFLPNAEVMREFNVSLYKILAISAVGILIAIGITILVAGKISNSVQRITDFSTEIAKGNYDASVETKGFTSEIIALKNSLSDMVTSLLESMREANKSKQAAEEGLRKAELAMAEAEKSKAEAEESQKSILAAAENIENVSTRLSTAAEELSAQVEESSRSAEQQREQIGMSVAAMEQMNNTVLDVAQNASKASEGSENTKRSAEEGAEIVKESISSIKEVEKNVNVLQEEMEGLKKQAEAIGTIMTVISDIADQTNLLALNAAIEAARAGEAGRGFAVVADEVRKLAEKTMTATGEVGQAITGIQHGMTRSVSALGVTTTNISKSTDLVTKSGEALADIVDEAVISATQISSIAAAVEEQSASCQHINSSLLDINRTSDEVAAAMQESSQAVMDLSRQASELEDLVGHLRSNE